ncbi:MerR family transcriptional regulator [Paenibacillus sp. GCM10028914]|uniref:MerR family transcriptional regulator n=1 Tax=Paenibacillus sp. GCM10028914 TaxID=3273416 RepID=UPI003621B0F3
MPESMEKKYTIGAFAAISGVSPDTLRLYEKLNIVCPHKNCNNNYRYYNDLDIRNVLMSRWYRSLNISLHDVSNLMNGGNSRQIIDRIAESKQNLEEHIRNCTLLLAKLNDIHKESEDIEDRINQCQIKHIPGRYRIKQTCQNSLLREFDWESTIREWMDLLPHTFFSFRIENTHEITCNPLQYNWGICLTEDDAAKLQVTVPDEVEYLPPTRCLSSVVHTSPQAPFSMKSFAFMLEEIANQGLEIKGDITGKIILTEHIEQTLSSYLEVNIPV